MGTQYEREIEEILRSLGDIGPRETPWQRFVRGVSRRWRDFWSGVRDLPRAIPADQLMLASILLILGAFVLRYISPSISRFVGAVGLIAFFAAFALSLRLFARGLDSDLRWRGRPIDLSYARSSWLRRLTRWLRRHMG